MLLHDLICFLDSIAERREEYTREDIRQQRSDDIDTRDPVELVGGAGILQEMLPHVRKLKGRRHRKVYPRKRWNIARALQVGWLLRCSRSLPAAATQ